MEELEDVVVDRLVVVELVVVEITDVDEVVLVELDGPVVAA